MICGTVFHSEVLWHGLSILAVKFTEILFVPIATYINRLATLFADAPQPTLKFIDVKNRVDDMTK